MMPDMSQQLEMLTQLKALLIEELELIVTRDADQLLDLVSKKETLLNEINGNQALLRLLKLPAGQRDEKTQSQVEEAIELLHACEKQTAVNAKAVESNQIKIQHLRKLLIETRAKESMTYDKAGRAQGGTLGSGIKA